MHSLSIATFHIFVPLESSHKHFPLITRLENILTFNISAGISRSSVKIHRITRITATAFAVAARRYIQLLTHINTRSGSHFMQSTYWWNGKSSLALVCNSLETIAHCIVGFDREKKRTQEECAQHNTAEQMRQTKKDDWSRVDQKNTRSHKIKRINAAHNIWFPNGLCQR